MQDVFMNVMAIRWWRPSLVAGLIWTITVIGMRCMSPPGAWRNTDQGINNLLDRGRPILHSECFYDKIFGLSLAHNATGIDEKWATPTFLLVRQSISSQYADQEYRL